MEELAAGARGRDHRLSHGGPKRVEGLFSNVQVVVWRNAAYHPPTSVLSSEAGPGGTPQTEGIAV